jgi:hypothetical protein
MNDRILELGEPDWVNLNGKLIQLHPPNEECFEILKSLEGTPASEYPIKMYKILALCLPDLTEPEVYALNLDQALAIQQRMVARMFARLPSPPPDSLSPPKR